jgi:hypothetical protein
MHMSMLMISEFKWTLIICQKINKTYVYHSQCYSYGEHFMPYLIFCWIWDNLTIFPAYTESRPSIWAFSHYHYSTSCQSPTIFWRKFCLGNCIMGYQTSRMCVLVFPKSLNNTYSLYTVAQHHVLKLFLISLYPETTHYCMVEVFESSQYPFNKISHYQLILS